VPDALTFDGAGAGAGVVLSAAPTLFPEPCGEGGGPAGRMVVSGAGAGAAGVSAELTLFPDPCGDGGGAAHAADATSKQPATTTKDFVMTLPPQVFVMPQPFGAALQLTVGGDKGCRFRPCAAAARRKSQ